MQVSLEVINKDGNGEECKKTYSNVNPAATYAQLDAFGRAITNLSKNTYQDSVRVERQSVNEKMG